MRCSIAIASMVAGVVWAAGASADTSSRDRRSTAAIETGTAELSAVEVDTGGSSLTARDDLDTVGEGIMIGEHARLESARGPIHIWTPRGYDPATAITVVYVHGYGIDVDEAWWGHGLPEQFGHAAINAMFIACEAPQDKWKEVHWTSLSRLLETVEASGRALPKGPVAAIGHSGAYRTLEQWVRDPRLDTLVLLDAGYGPLYWVRSWILGKPGRRLIDIGDDTLMFTDYLHRFLPSTVTLQGYSRFADRAFVERLSRERIVYIRSTIGHYPIAHGALALPAVLRILGARPLEAGPVLVAGR
jgi:hypothetical protein